MKLLQQPLSVIKSEKEGLVLYSTATKIESIMFLAFGAQQSIFPVKCTLELWSWKH